MKEQPVISFPPSHTAGTSLDNDPNDTPPRSRFTLSSAAIVSFAQLGLGYDLAGLRRGLEAVIRSERRVSPTVFFEPDSLTLFAFTLAASPSLAAEWSEALLFRVELFEDEPSDTFCFNDAQYHVSLSVRDNVVVEVRPLPKRTSPKSRG